MKKLILLLVILFVAVNTILGQNQKYVIEPSRLVVDQKIQILCKNVTDSSGKIEFPVGTDYKIMLEGIEIINPSILLTKNGLQIRMIIPSCTEFFGKEKNLEIIKGDSICAQYFISVAGNIPQNFDPDLRTILYRGDDYKSVEVVGENVGSIINVCSKNHDLSFKPNSSCYLKDGHFYINVKALPDATPAKNAELKFSYISPISFLTDTVKNIFILGISENERIRVKEIVPCDFYIDEVKNQQIEFSFSSDNLFNKDHTYLLNSLELPFSESSVNIKPETTTNRLKIRVLIDGNNFGSGDKYFEIKDVRTNELYKGKINIYDRPTYGSVRDRIKPSLSYSPYDKADLLISGNNISLAKFNILNNKDSAITYVKKINSADEIEIYLNFNDSVKIGKYQFRIIWSYNKGDIPQNKDIGQGEILVVEPHEIENLSKMIRYKVDSTCVNFIPGNYISVGNKQDLSICVLKNSIEDKRGPQAVIMKATLYSEDNDLIGSIDYQNENSGDFNLVGTKSRIYDNALDSIPWNNLKREFEQKLNRQIRPWSRIVVEVSHDKEYYKNYAVVPRTQVQTFIIKGNFWSNISSTITLPPALFVFGQKKVEGKYENKMQVLPLNVGYGIQWQPRNKDFRKKFFSAGIYVSGLNFLGTTDEDTTKIIVSDTITTIKVQNNNLIDKGSVNLVMLSEFSVFNKENKIQLPIQVGLGWQIPVNGIKSQWYGVIGFGINYRF